MGRATTKTAGEQNTCRQNNPKRSTNQQSSSASSHTPSRTPVNPLPPPPSTFFHPLTCMRAPNHALHHLKEVARRAGPGPRLRHRGLPVAPARGHVGQKVQDRQLVRGPGRAVGQPRAAAPDAAAPDRAPGRRPRVLERVEPPHALGQEVALAVHHVAALGAQRGGLEREEAEPVHREPRRRRWRRSRRRRSSCRPLTFPATRRNRQAARPAAEAHEVVQQAVAVPPVLAVVQRPLLRRIR